MNFQTQPSHSLDFVVNVPDVLRHGVGTSLQVPGGQGQLVAELLHVGRLCDGLQGVGAPAEQEVTKGSFNRSHVWREEGVLNLRIRKKENKNQF